MLRNLKMSFALLAAHGTGVALVRMVAAPVWGRLIDRLGARPVLIACSFGISGIPFVWLFASESFLWPLLADCTLAGLLWGGHALATFNLPLAVTPRDERPYYLAAFASVAGLSFSVATLAGGLLAELLPDRVELWGYALFDLQLVFACSGALRLVAAFVSLRIQEPSARSLDALWPALGAFVPAPLRLRRAAQREQRTSRAA
jgi:MFS family permease